MNHQFRQAVTAIAFNLTLSKQMIISLVSIAHGDRMRMDVFRHLGMVDCSCVSAKALEHRGLIVAPDTEFPGLYELTKAGELTLELLKEADLVRDIQNKLAGGRKNRLPHDTHS